MGHKMHQIFPIIITQKNQTMMKLSLSPLLLLKKASEHRYIANNLRPIVSDISQEVVKKIPQLQPYVDNHVQPYFVSAEFPDTLPLADKITRLNQQVAPDILIEQSGNHSNGDSVIVWLNVPEKRNAMNFRMMEKLIIVANVLAVWRELRAVILAGQGKSFCTGLHLSDLNNKQNFRSVIWELAKPSQSLFQQVCLVWRELSVPVISVVHGHCLGAGLQLALATDIRISTPDCQFAIMEAKWGLVADMGLTQSGFGVLRADVVKELAMTARLFDGKQALDYGVVSYINDDPMTHAKQLVAEIATRSPDAVSAAKHLTNQMYSQSPVTLYQEKLWQLKMLMSKNRPVAVKKAKDFGVQFLKRQF